MKNYRSLKVVNIVLVGLIFGVLTGCAGIKFNNATNVFKPIPSSLKTRTVWHDPSIIQYKLQSLSGYMIEKKEDEQEFRRVKQIVPQDFSVEPEPIADGQFYHSIVNAEYAGSGNATIPVLSVAASLSANQMMEVTIVDIALIHVDDQQIPWAELTEFIQQNPIGENDERYWVQAVMLTQFISKTATGVESDAQVSGGAYQVNGKVYNSSETQDKTPFITMLLLDVDKAVQKEDRSNFNGEEAIKRGRIVKNIQVKLK